jgi:peptide/nickel transport system substrate-binding protein/microcin C transport system substrate-binding protein
MFVQPATSGQGGRGFRANLGRALELFAEAGWTLRGGELRNAAGERFVVELPGTKAQSPLNDPYEQALRSLGIEVRKAIVDAAVTRARLNAFDFDFSAIALRDGRNPANELWRTFNAKAADTLGSENLAGVKSPVIDALLLRLRDAASKDEQIAVGRALDRVIMHGQHVLPWRYLEKHYLMFNRRLARPAVLPTYYGANEWALATWWDTTAAPGPLTAR